MLKLFRILAMTALTFSLVVLLPSCSMNEENVFIDRVYLSYRYRLEACGDVHGQDISEGIWFSDLNPDLYSHLFNLDFSDSFADFHVGVDDHGVGYGYGTLKVTFKDGTGFLNERFSYYCIQTATTGGYFVSNLSKGSFGAQVYCIYWVRINVAFVVPDTKEEITLTLHFRGGEPNPRPSEFGR